MNSNTIPSAEEFLKEYVDEEIYNAPFFAYVNGEKLVHQAMIDFAVEHTKAALQSASEKAKVKLTETSVGHDFEYTASICFPDTDSILNAYPIELIK